LIHAVLGSVSLNKLLAGTLLAFACISSHADDLKVADDFKSGDLVSADTFNQIFDTIEKINRTVVDTDLVGVWSCDAMTTRNTSGWTSKSLFYILENSQVNLTASSSATSLESAYTISTSSPSPFKRTLASAFSGTYILHNNKLFTKQADESEARIWDVNIISSTRFELTFLETSAQSFPTNYASFITCDSAEAVPASPTSPTATNNKTGINLAWTDASSDETGFKVYRKLSSESEAKLIATQTAVTYSDTDLAEGQTAYYHVTAYNDNGDSAKSKVMSATLDNTAPTILTVAPINSASISHNWSSGSAPLPFSGTSASDTAVTVSITFSEKVEVTVEGAVSVTSTRTINKNQTESKAYTFLEKGVTGTTLAFSVPALAFQLESNAMEDDEVENLSITVKSGEIKDANGILLAQDYVWSFTVTNDGGMCAGFAHCD